MSRVVVVRGHVDSPPGDRDRVHPDDHVQQVVVNRRDTAALVQVLDHPLSVVPSSEPARLLVPPPGTSTTDLVDRLEDEARTASRAEYSILAWTALAALAAGAIAVTGAITSTTPVLVAGLVVLLVMVAVASNVASTAAAMALVDWDRAPGLVLPHGKHRWSEAAFADLTEAEAEVLHLAARDSPAVLDAVLQAISHDHDLREQERLEETRIREEVRRAQAEQCTARRAAELLMRLEEGR